MLPVIYTTATHTGNGQAATWQVQGPVRIEPARLASSTSGVSFIRRLNSESSICNWCNQPHSHTKPCYGRSKTISCSDSWFSYSMGQLGKRGAVCRAIRPRFKGQRSPWLATQHTCKVWYSVKLQRFNGRCCTWYLLSPFRSTL